MIKVPPTILILNPNSNTDVTTKMAKALEEISCPESIRFLCETLETGPFGIETQSDVESVIEPVAERISEGNENAAVIACYSDPGLRESKAVTSKPVFGIQESAISAAISRHSNFGVIALSETSKARHLKYIEELGHLDRLAGERVANLSVAESAGGGDTFAKLVAAGEQLRDLDGANVVILGCAGMARHRLPLANALGLEVIDPIQAAVERAIEAIG